jgi:hypothetical protein
MRYPQPGSETVKNTGRGTVACRGGPRKLVLNLAQESRAGRRGSALYAENKHDWRYQFGQSQGGNRRFYLLFEPTIAL